MLKIKTTDNDTIEVYTPYSVNFTSELKRRISGRKWDGSKRCWVVTAESIDFVRKLMEKHFGESDISDTEKVTVIVSFAEELATCDVTNIELFGKTVAKAYGRDKIAPISGDVVYIEGSYESGGSTGHPLVRINAGSVLEIYNVAVSAIDAMKDKLPVGVTYSIKDTSRKDVLLAEKERLIAKLEAIEKELATL